MGDGPVSGTKIKPNPAPARDVLILRVIAAQRNQRGAVTLELEPERAQVIDFYPQPNQQQRRRHGNGS